MGGRSISIDGDKLLSVMERLHATRCLLDIAADVVRIKKGESGRLACTVFDLECVSGAVRDTCALFGGLFGVTQTREMALSDLASMSVIHAERGNEEVRRKIAPNGSKAQVTRARRSAAQKAAWVRRRASRENRSDGQCG